MWYVLFFRLQHMFSTTSRYAFHLWIYGPGFNLIQIWCPYVTCEVRVYILGNINHVGKIHFNITLSALRIVLAVFLLGGKICHQIPRHMLWLLHKEEVQNISTASIMDTCSYNCVWIDVFFSRMYTRVPASSHNRIQHDM